MKMPRTMSEALKQGYVVDGFSGHASHGETRESGHYILVKQFNPQPEDQLQVPYTSTIKFGRPRRYHWKRRRRA